MDFEFVRYHPLWEQLTFAEGLRVLDFGSGAGQTADHLAARNTVTAIEPCAEQIARCERNHAYAQIQGSIDDLPGEQFDLVACHNVLEFVDDRERYLEELAKRVRPGGRLSILKHNLAGKALRRDDPAGALMLLQGREQASNRWGTIRVYDTGELIEWAEQRGFTLEQHYGIHAIFPLGPNGGGWDDREALLALERYTAQLEPYRSVAYYHHVILRRTEAAI